MPETRRIAFATPVFLLALFSASCGLLVKSRAIIRHGQPLTQGQTLMEATRDELNERIANIYNPIGSFQATVDMTPSVGSVYTGQITEIKDVRAFVLYRKTNDIRIIGQTPLVRTRAFDMVSDGNRFSLYISTKNLFVEGDNKAPTTSKNKLENLRPEAFLSSMLIRPATADEIPVLYDQTDEENATYVLLLLKRDAKGELVASRSIWFDRLDLSIIRQLVFDGKAGLVSDTRYAKWQTFDKTLFPSHIDINRPQDGYGVAMDVMQMQMNKTMTDDQFVLARPEGSQLQVIGSPAPSAAPGASK
jgi:hypothetical protein